MARGRGPFAGGPERAQRTLIKAAESCFADYGLHRTTMDDIARRAGISRTTMYRYFRDRDELVASAIERRAQRFIERARDVIDGYPTFADKLVEGLVYLIAGGRADAMVSTLVRPDSLDLTTDALMGTNVAQELSHKLWGPVFEQAQQSGEMRRDLDPLEVSGWLCDVELVLIGRADLASPSDPDYRTAIRDFVLPALQP